MKRLIPLCLLIPLLALAQGSPQCSQSQTLTTTGTTPVINTTTGASAGCVGWRLTWSVTGWTAMQIQIEGSQDNSSWAAFSGSTIVIEGSNPTNWTSATASNTIVVRASQPYVRVNVVSKTGSGSVKTTLYGYIGTSAQMDTGGGGATPFSAITSGTNTQAHMTVGTGAQLDTSGSGTIAATSAINLAGGSTGSVPYQSAVDTTGFAVPNATTTPKCFLQSGDGSTANAPAFGLCPSASLLIYYFSNTASSISTYLQMTSQPYTPKTTLTYTGQVGTVTNTLQNWATNANVPGLTFIPAGEYIFHVHASRNHAGSGTLQLRCQFVEVNSVGVDIAVIGTSELTPNLTASEVEYELAFADGNVYTLASAGSRIVARVQAVNTAIGTSSAATIYVGDEADTHISLPSNGGSSGAGGGGVTFYSRELTTFSGTEYFPVGGGSLPDTTEANVQTASPASATVANFFVNLSAPLGTGNSAVFTWRKGGASQAVTCTISGASATSCSDSSHFFNAASGDLLDVQAAVTGIVTVTPTVTMAATFGDINPASGQIPRTLGSAIVQTNFTIATDNLNTIATLVDVTAGNLMAVAYAYEGGNTPTVSDTQGTVYSLAVLASNLTASCSVGCRTAVFVGPILSSGPDTITATMAGAVAQRLAYYELAGYTALDATNTVTGATATTVTTSSANGLILAVFGSFSNSDSIAFQLPIVQGSATSGLDGLWTGAYVAGKPGTYNAIGVYSGTFADLQSSAVVSFK